MKVGKWFLMVIMIVGLYYCSVEKSGALKDNVPPTTHVYLSGDLDTTRTIQIVHWWGDDIDGEVVGFYYIWDTPDLPLSEWTWTTATMDTFYLSIESGEQAAVRTFYVKAVDDNAVFVDGLISDSLPPTSIENAIDETPASVSIPIKNTPPEIKFVVNSNPNFEQAGTNIFETFTTHSFFWDATDYDGDNTIDHIEYCLDDSNFTDPVILDATKTSITLTNLEPGNHVFYVRAVDIADSKSNIIRFPEDNTKTWTVKPVVGDFLLIDDDALEINDANTNFYTTILDELGVSYSTWNIEKILPYSQIDFTATLNFFNNIIWYSGLPTTATAHMQTAASSITDYLENSDHSLLLNSPKICNDDLIPYSFAPIDSIIDDRIVRVRPGVGFVTLVNGFDSLSVSNMMYNFVGFETDTTLAMPLYKLPPVDQVPSGNSWKGEPDIGLIRRADAMNNKGTLIFLSFPVYKADGNSTANHFIKYILQNEFGIGGNK